MAWGSLCDWVREVFPVVSLREVTCGPALRAASGTWSLTPPSQDSRWRWQDGGRAEPLVRARRCPLPQPRQGLPRILLPCPPLRFLWSVQDPLHNSWSQQQDERQGLLFKNYPEFQDDSRAFNQEWSPSEHRVYVTAQAAHPGSRPEWMQPVAGLMLGGAGKRRQEGPCAQRFQREGPDTCCPFAPVQKSAPAVPPVSAGALAHTCFPAPPDS